MGAPGLNQVGMTFGLFLQPLAQLTNSWQQLLLNGLGRGDMHGRRKAVVGALRAIDMVIGVHWAFAATAAARQFIGASGNHFIDVHVALGAAAGLPDHQGELFIMLAGEHLIGGLLNQPCQIGWQITDALVDSRCGFFDQHQGMHHRQGHAFLANREVEQRTLSLSPPVSVIRYFDWAQAVSFSAAHGGSPDGCACSKWNARRAIISLGVSQLRSLCISRGSTLKALLPAGVGFTEPAEGIADGYSLAFGAA